MYGAIYISHRLMLLSVLRKALKLLLLILSVKKQVRQIMNDYIIKRSSVSFTLKFALSVCFMELI